MKKLNLKAYLAEFIGTFVLVFCACGVAAFTGCVDAGGIVATALAFGLVIVAMAYSIGRISGCHINPAVSIAMLVNKKMSVVDFCFYVVAQIIGGFVGAVSMFGIFQWGGVSLKGNACNMPVGYTAASGATTGGIVGALLVEVILTFIFVYVILNVTDSKNEATQKSAGLIIGGTLTLVHLIGICLTGTSVNPARSLATALGDLIFNGKTAALEQVWIFIFAPLVGGIIAALVFKALHQSKEDK